MPKAIRSSRLVVALLVAGSIVAACSDRGTSDTPSVDDALVPQSDLIMGWIEEIVAQGIRRPGYPADDWVETWARDRFVALGLEDVRLDPVEVSRWEPLHWSLTAWHDDRPAETLSIPCYAIPFSGGTSTDGVTGTLEPFTVVEGENPEDLSGKIALVENEFIALPQSVMPMLFARWQYDPEGVFDDLVQTLPFSSAFQNVMDPSIEAGAIGFLGILRGLPWDTDQYYVPYDAVERPIPGAWLSAKNGDRLLAFLAEGPAHGRLVVERDLRPATSHNVTGILRGASDQWVIVGSHHDGPWASAVEDASGTSLVMAQAQYWSQVPVRKRPHNMLFLLNSGHMSGGAGLHHFVDTNRDFIERDVVAEIHLEHAARRARGENGVLVPTDAPEVRWWFTSFVPPLEEAVADAICAEGLGRSFLMPVEGFPPGSTNPPTDAAFFHPLTPIVSFLTAPMYLFDAQDTIDKIHQPSLVPLTRATIRIIDALAGETAASVRATTYTPPRAEPLAPCSERAVAAS